MPDRGDSFPRQYARTRRFTLGHPRSFSVAADGSRVAFLRSPGGEDPMTCLWVLDVETGSERLIADPRSLMPAQGERLSDQERARRERARETAGGIVAYAGDRNVTVAAFGLGGRLFLADLVSGEVRELPAKQPVFDPRPDPTGRRVAYVSDGALRVVEDEGVDRLVVADEDPEVTWGMAEFIAAEEMGRLRGYWWSPDGTTIAGARVDNRTVPVWYIADPSDPARQPEAVRYPAAGTSDAEVGLAVLGVEDGSVVDVRWDREAFPYLVAARWQREFPPTMLVQSRDQGRWRVLSVDVESGATETLWEDASNTWLEIVTGVPAWTDDGRLVFVREIDDTHRLTLDAQAVTPPGLHVSRVVHVARDVILIGSEGEPMEQHVWRVAPDGTAVRVTEAPGVHEVVAGGDVLVVSSSSMDRDQAEVIVWRGGDAVCPIDSHAAVPLIRPSVTFGKAGRREIRSALLFPGGREPDQKLPVLLDPYGGPHAQRVMAARPMYLASQWLADQGFAVLVADGRGTPGRGLGWEKAVRFDLATPALEDQVEALHAAAALNPALDLSRVAIRGWSFGGYLSALAILRRPDVFHAAIAGAPVTDWRLYDTHYTERYLGHPDQHPDAYERSSLLDEAASLERPLLLIHGLADDNVVVSHTLRFSRALLEAGRPHQVLPLSGVTHMTPQEVVAENLLLLQVAFLKEALGLS